jgi:hypothetical protein
VYCSKINLATLRKEKGHYGAGLKFEIIFVRFRFDCQNKWKVRSAVIPLKGLVTRRQELFLAELASEHALFFTAVAVVNICGVALANDQVILSIKSK